MVNLLRRVCTQLTSLTRASLSWLCRSNRLCSARNVHGHRRHCYRQRRRDLERSIQCHHRLQQHRAILHQRHREQRSKYSSRLSGHTVFGLCYSWLQQSDYRLLGQCRTSIRSIATLAPACCFYNDIRLEHLMHQFDKVIALQATNCGAHGFDFDGQSSDCSGNTISDSTVPNPSHVFALNCVTTYYCFGPSC